MSHRNSKGNQKKVEDEENDIPTLIRNLEANLKAHTERECKALKDSIHENNELITKATQIANNAHDLANENKGNVDLLSGKIDKLEDEKKKLQDQVSTHSLQINVLQSRLEDQTCRNTRNTLIIRGIPKTERETSWEHTRKAVYEALADIIDLEEAEIDEMIERVHRGTKQRNNDDADDNDNRAEADGKIPPIQAKFYNWNDCQTILQLMRKAKSNIFVDQMYGPDTTYRQNQALALRKELKAAGTIKSGFVRYPARLFVKYPNDPPKKKYSFYQDFSEIPIPAPVPRR